MKLRRLAPLLAERRIAEERLRVHFACVPVADGDGRDIIEAVNRDGLLAGDRNVQISDLPLWNPRPSITIPCRGGIHGKSEGTGVHSAGVEDRENESSKSA